MESTEEIVLHVQKTVRVVIPATIARTTALVEILVALAQTTAIVEKNVQIAVRIAHAVV